MQKVVIMTEQEAKEVIRNDPKGDIIKRLEAIAVAEDVLGDDCTMSDIWKWANEEKAVVAGNI